MTCRFNVLSWARMSFETGASFPPQAPRTGTVSATLKVKAKLRSAEFIGVPWK
jgi:hypothetical protein